MRKVNPRYTLGQSYVVPAAIIKTRMYIRNENRFFDEYPDAENKTNWVNYEKVMKLDENGAFNVDWSLVKYPFTIREVSDGFNEYQMIQHTIYIMFSNINDRNLIALLYL